MLIAGLNLPIVEFILILQLGILIFSIIIYREEKRKHKELLNEILGEKVLKKKRGK